MRNFTFSYVWPLIVILLDAVTPKFNFEEEMVELENWGRSVGVSFDFPCSSRILRLPSLVDDSVAADLCLEVLSLDLQFFVFSVVIELPCFSINFLRLEVDEFFPVKYKNFSFLIFFDK